MGVFSGSEDIYRELVENVPEDEEWLLGLVSFAIVEERRIEWMKHFEKINGIKPTPSEVEKWYGDQPNNTLLLAKDTAKTRLESYAQDAIAVYDEDNRNEILEGIIIQEIQDLKRRGPQLLVNIVGGLISALVFAIMLALFVIVINNDSSPVEITNKILSEK